MAETDEDRRASSASAVKKAVRKICLVTGIVLVVIAIVGFIVDFQLKRARYAFVYGCQAAQIDFDRCDMLADAHGYASSIPRLVRYWYVKHRMQAFVPHLGP
ncbi:MAG TPA: hypothetical protein VL244_06790 [Alphaproteobacteria bacterium]|nr:hypothetical protein [Alphaproteobacteria bacterium]